MKFSRTFDIVDNLLNIDSNKSILAAKIEEEWTHFSVKEYQTNARMFALGLLAKGFKKGDKIATVSNNRPEWNFVDMGMSKIGVIHVPIYPTIGDEEYRFILEHSEVKILIVSDIQLYKKLTPIAKEISNIEAVYTFNDIENASHWSEITQLGEEKKTFYLDELQNRKNEIKTDDVASIIYTSGTTGFPKGVKLCHKNFISNLEGVYDLFPLGPNDRALSFLPLCHVFERISNYLFQAKGVTIYYAENLGTIASNLIEIRATVFVSVPRVIERIYDKIVSKGEDLTGLKRTIFFWALKLGEHYNVNGKLSYLYKIKLAIARKLVFSKWSTALGGNLSFIISGGAALQPRLSRLFFAAGISLMEGYGLTETAPVIAVNSIIKSNSLMIGTVGPVLLNQKVKIDSDGEILVKGDNVMLGYLNDDAATAEVIDKDGWFHSGDIGELVNDRFLKITDRKKEIFKLSSGKYIAPQVIENLLKESIFIEQAMVVGDHEKFASALISPNFDYLHGWANDHKIHYRDNKELVQLKDIIALYQKEVNKINKQTGNHESIKRFRLVCDAWGARSGELSPTLKLRRRVLYKKYSQILREIYGYQQDEKTRGTIALE